MALLRGLRWAAVGVAVVTTAVAGQITPNPGTLFGIMNLFGSGTSGQYDGQIVVTGGGSQPGHGAANYTAAQQNFATYDGTPQFQVGTTPAAVEYWSAWGGTSGLGGTFYATNGTLAGNVDGNFVTQNLGNFWFGSGAGTGFEVASPSTPATGYLKVTPGTSTTDPVLSASAGANVNIDAPSGQIITMSIAGVVGAVVENPNGAVTTTTNYASFRPSLGGVGIVARNAAGTGGVNFNLKAQSTGSVNFLNDAGTMGTIGVSGANTVADGILIRASSTTDPIILTGLTGTSVAVGGGSLVTTATKGFLMIPFGAGPPTGVPAQLGKGVPLYFDTTNLKLCAYSGAWKCSGAFS